MYSEAWPYISTVHLLSFAGFTASLKVILWHLLLIGLGYWVNPFSNNSKTSVFIKFSYGILMHTAILLLLHYASVYVLKRFFPILNWGYLLAGYMVGLFLNKGNYLHLYVDFRQQIQFMFVKLIAKPNLKYLAVISLLTIQLPFTIIPYSHSDVKEFYAPRAFLIEKLESSEAISQSPVSSYPPLYSILLWMGMGDSLFQGRILPFLWFLSFVCIFAYYLKQYGIERRSWILLYFLATAQVWMGMVTYYANVPLMILLCSAAFLMFEIINEKSNINHFKEYRIWLIMLFLSAASIIRPDGLYYAIILIAGFFLYSSREKRKILIWISIFPLIVGLSWYLRPDFLRGGELVLKKVDPEILTKWGAGLHWKTVVNFLYAWQGLYLSHYGFGAFFYAFIVAYFLERKNKTYFNKTFRNYRILSVVFLCSVAVCYLGVGLFLNPTLDYYIWVRVSLGRATVHLYPIMLMYTFAVFNRTKKLKQITV